MFNRPDFVTDEILKYLDWLRESGVVNMHEASPYIAYEFGLDSEQSELALKYWITTFGSDDR